MLGVEMMMSVCVCVLKGGEGGFRAQPLGALVGVAGRRDLLRAPFCIPKHAHPPLSLFVNPPS